VCNHLAMMLRRRGVTLMALAGAAGVGYEYSLPAMEVRWGAWVASVWERTVEPSLGQIAAKMERSLAGHNRCLQRR